MAERVDPKAWAGADEVVGGNSEGRWVDEGEAEAGARPDRVSCGLWGAGSEDRGRVCDLLSGVPEPKAPGAAVEDPPKRDMPGVCGAGSKEQRRRWKDRRVSREMMLHGGVSGH